MKNANSHILRRRKNWRWFTVSHCPVKRYRFIAERAAIAAETPDIAGEEAFSRYSPSVLQIRKMIADGSSDGQIKQQAIQEGMRTLTKAAIDDMLAGNTTIDELMRVVDLRAD